MITDDTKRKTTCRWSWRGQWCYEDGATGCQRCQKWQTGQIILVLKDSLPSHEWLLSTSTGHMSSLSSPFQFVYWPRRMIPSPLPSTQTPYIWIQRTPTLECWNPTLSKEASSSLCWHPNSHNCKGPPSSWRLSQQSLSECWEEEEHCCSLQESVHSMLF